ncbi:hypothetical protein [Wolbachia endosymbiont (group A) of Anomoia purmunda]|uniref:hypothetical protein n=1 Tax=Wolbachia endosymbiont (group A) of Anomoia purmunda TaxID=2953978 RepID=UPI002230CF4D|nr:hypothetical protein [Wolbachia endosymbiont (group A) of Anomoia purmunda]
MADSGTNIALSKETLEDLTRLSKVKKQPVQKLIEELVQEAVEHEEDMALLKLSIQRNVPGAETVDFEDIKWD